MIGNGHLVLSLDFELLWGVFDVVDYPEKKDYFKNTRKAIPLILKEFQKHGIHCTWATVGMLFNKNWGEWEENIPKAQPNYFNPKLSAYHYGNKIKSTETENLCFAPQLIRKISETHGQEIGTHTYSHYYCREEGQNLEQFKADLQQAVKMAGKLELQLKSLVFPRNQFNAQYLEVCADLGIENVRSNPSSWYWENTRSNALHTKLARTGDAYIPLGKKSYSLNEAKKKNKMPFEQKASRFLRPVEGNGFLRKLKLKRIKNEMTRAAKNNEVYHLWWHPHNFGDKPEESLKDLSEILNHFQKCRQSYNFQSMNMQELGNLTF